MKALNLFLVEERTGAPIAGVVVAIFADEQPLAMLESGPPGYVSWKGEDSALTAVSRLTVSHNSAQLLVVEVADLLAGRDTYTVRIGSSLTIAPQLGLPAVLDPDIRDLAVSPASIGLIPQLIPGVGLCAQLMPTTMTVRRFRTFQVRADICNPETIGCRVPGSDRPFQKQWQIVKGKILEYEIAWHYAGTSLGDLLNTITLAPCEQVNIAIADWTRRETASRTEATDVRQESIQHMDHDRLIHETMNSTTKSKGKALAFGLLKSKKTTLPIDPFKFDITSAFGGGFSSTTSSSTMALNTMSSLSEHIKQAASFVASQRSSVVFQATASEQHLYQTRCIRNQNHCRTETFVYYQINANYRVVTDYKGERDVILVRYPNETFNAKRAYCNASVLREALLDPDLDRCFDELGDALFCCEEEKSALIESLTVFVRVAAAFNTSQMRITLLTTTGAIQLPQTIVWQGGGTYTQTVGLPAAIDPQQITGLFFHLVKQSSSFLSTSPVLVLDEMKVTFGQNGTLFSSQAQFSIFQNWSTAVKAEVPPPSDADNECVAKSCCVKKLVAHLNCHGRYYNSALWLAQDPDERVMQWSCCGRDGSPFSLIGEIENDPITVYGDFLVFPVAGSQLVDNPTILPVSKLVSMPTPGVYSEGILGQCNTCEKIDPDRYWNWKDSPCPDCPPLPAPLTPQTGVKPSDLKADVISNLITLSPVPGAPDSILKDLVSALVAKADTGSEVAKSLLASLLTAIKDAVAPPADKK